MKLMWSDIHPSSFLLNPSEDGGSWSRTNLFGSSDRRLPTSAMPPGCVKEVERPSLPPPRSGRLAPLGVERHALDVEVLAPRRARLRVVAEQQVFEAVAERALRREQGHARLLGRAAALARVARDAEIGRASCRERV